MNILFADDDALTREVVAMWLVKRGYDVTVVQNGTQLLKVVEHGPGTFDVIVTDNNMPGGPSGLEVLRHLRADERFKSVPVIVHSGDAAELIKAEVEALDAVFAEKYRRPNELLSALNDLPKT